MFLRLLVHQALGEGASLLLGDLDGRTFPMLEGHPALLEPVATTAEAMLGIVERGLGECEARAALYDLVDGFPDSLSEYNASAVQQGQATLPRVLVVLDEFNAAALATGGANGRLARAAAELGWRGRKFGISLAFAAQDFTKAVVGRVRDQVGATVCFRVKSAEVARAVGCAEAVSIPESRPGMALSDRWGVMQAYCLDKSALITAAARPGPALTEREAQVVEAARADGGRMTLALLQTQGYSRNEAARLLDDWKARGWVTKDASQQNAHVLSDRFPPFPAFPAFPTVSQVSQFSGLEG
jgi:DNA segregation ATPase FtsK/SpoIIIE-like protein